MKFSVVIPTYNRAEILRKCLDAFAHQTYSDFEVIVVNDGSTDNTAQIARAYPFVRYIEQPHQGGARLLNVGWRHASGEMILMTDDDCIGPPHWLAILADGAHRYPDVVAVGTYAGPPDALIANNRFARYDAWEWKSNGGRLTEYVGGVETPTAGLVAYKRFALEEVGGFNEGLFMAGAHDHDIKQRLTTRGSKFLYIPLKIEHHRPYTKESFRQQHIGRGRAAVRYELATTGKAPGYTRIVLRALKCMLVLPKNLIATPDKALAWTIFEARWFNCVGQWQEQRALAKTDS